MVNEIVREVNMCLDNGCCIAGLSLALTLPDICGKAYYPTLGNKRRYIQWFDENLGMPKNDEERALFGMPDLSGALVYSLRCSLLHQGNPNIKKNEFGIIYFELLYRQHEGVHIITSSSQAEIVKDEDGKEKEINRMISINVRNLCEQICIAAEKCYQKDKNKFDFFDYNLVDTDYTTRRLFELADRGVIK